MKAYLLAAGLGTRLRPITDTIPKCLVPICHRPLLAWWVDLFDSCGITEVLINTHYLTDPVREFIGQNNRTSRVKLVEVYEQELKGSAGTIRDNRDFVRDSGDFLIAYADNLTNADLAGMTAFHKMCGAPLTMGLFHTNDPKGCGIAALDSQNHITEFVEKPENPKSDLANAGIYVANETLFSYIPKEGMCDLGKDVLPHLVGKMSGFEIKDYLIDIGTMQNYEKAQTDWKSIMENTK
ncbi:MAG: nucleotidyltransferase family protein [Lachnospiraceae bacterium]|nr:nucleotidyltransferase family protein [Lachnospiraceae bacterium]